MYSAALEKWTDKPWSKRPRQQVRSSGAPIAQPVRLRTTDAFYNVPSSWLNRNDHDHESDREDPEDANHFLHEVPESVQNLFDALQNAGVAEGPRIHDSDFLRSWCVHHVHAPQCFQYRVIEINGDWRLWFQDIINTWRDRITPPETTMFDVVHPNPPRTANNHEFIFDSIFIARH